MGVNILSRKILGLDLGIGSVGWGIIDNFKIVATGVRLFEEAAKDKDNTSRRNFRSLRRQLRRRKARILRMYKYLEEIGIIMPNFKYLDNPYEIRAKGLKEKLTSNELATALLHLAKRRGSSLEIAEEPNEKEGSIKEILRLNEQKLENKFISEVQLEKLNKEGRVRGYDNLYKTSDYIKETIQILSHQDINDEQRKRIVDIIATRRLFSDGPGSESHPTIYGRYRPVDKKLKHEIVNMLKDSNHPDYLKKVFKLKYKDNEYRIMKSGMVINANPLNLIDIMKGKCSVFPNEFRAAKMSFSAELHNFLNDLNNLTINKDTKLTTEQKQEIIEIVLEKGKFSYTDLKKYLGIKDDNQLSGLRLNKEKPVLTDFKGFSKLLKVYKQHEEKLPNSNILDQIAEILTIYQAVEDRESKLSSLLSNRQVVEDLSKLTGFNGTHAFSYKALSYLNNELLHTEYNQMQILENSKIRKERNFKDINIDDDITNPVVRRVHREAFKVYKALEKEFGTFDAVIIETTRDKNSKEERKRISDIQKRNQQNKEHALSILEDSGYSADTYLNPQLELKIRLYQEQQCKCAYTGVPLSLSELIRDPQRYQVDHIIPFSISLDDSFNNKVLVTASVNQLKGNKTPFMYFSQGLIDEGVFNDYNDFKSYVLNLNISKAKKDNLLFEQDINKYDVQKMFVSKNLVDTSYGIRSFMNYLKLYFSHHDIDTKVHTIKGKQTSLFRKLAANQWFKENPNSEIKNPLLKDRNEYRHHAIDALIVAASYNQKAIRLLYQINVTDDFKHIYNDKTGEIVQHNPLKDSELPMFYKQLFKLSDDEIRFSWKLDSKVNRSISDQTIYSTRVVNGESYVVKKYRNIYELDDKTLKKIFEDPEKSGILVYKNDKKTYEILYNAYLQYAHEKYPFKAYLEQNGLLRKYAKNKEGAPVTSLKYVENRLGNHIDISKNYQTTRKVVLLQLSTYRIDVYQKGDIYKFITIRYHDVKYNHKIKAYEINEEWYHKQKLAKKISSDFEFKFSLFRNSLVEITKEDKNETETKRWRIISTNNDSKNIIELKSYAKLDEKREYLSVGSKLKELNKYNVSASGQMQRVFSERLHFIVK